MYSKVRFMEKCPKCGQWTVALNSRREVVVCRNMRCDYEKPVNVAQYLRSNNILPKLVESSGMNGRTKAVAKG